MRTVLHPRNGTAMKYVDGFVIVMPEENLPAYHAMAKNGAKIWMKHGALEYFECVGNDLSPDMGGVPIATFPKMTKAKAGKPWSFRSLFSNQRPTAMR